MKDLLLEVLDSFGYPVMLQGTLGEDEPYPDSFFTFWANSSDDHRHYDNKTHGYEWSFDVNFYSVDPALVNTKLLDAKQLLQEHGFIVPGKGYDLVSDEPTHTGRGINARIIEK